jgi:hypothetical protein
LCSKTNLLRDDSSNSKKDSCDIIYDFVVQKPGDRNTKNLDLEALFAQTKLLELQEDKVDDQRVYRVKVQDGSDSKRVDKLMDYLKYRGCAVNMLQRYVANPPPQPAPKEKRALPKCLEEDVEDEILTTPPRALPANPQPRQN